MPPTAVLVRLETARAMIPARGLNETGQPFVTGPALVERNGAAVGGNGTDAATLVRPAQPQRFYGSVDLDMSRPVKAFEAILNNVILELQRTPGAKVRLTLEVEAEAPDGFDEADVGVVRDNARQLKFKADSTGFDN